MKGTKQVQKENEKNRSEKDSKRRKGERKRWREYKRKHG
jgi:hypothetical protein